MTHEKGLKTEGFAVGLSPTDYYLISGLADRLGTTKMDVAAIIIDHFVKHVLAGKLLSAHKGE